MPRQIKAAVFTAESGNRCEIQNVLLADPEPSEIVIEVKACGICHTDIGVAGYQDRPAVLGHEAAGVVVEIGSAVSEFKVGDPIVATFGSCGTCATCKSNNPAYCIDHAAINFDGLRPNGKGGITDTNGKPIFSAFFQQSGFATHALVQMENVVKLPTGISFVTAAPLGCGIQTGAGSVMTSLGVKPNESLVIFGVGSAGLTAVMAAKHIGCCPIIAIDLDAGRLELAKKYGAHHTLNGLDGNLTEIIKDLTNGGAHYSLEGTGNNSIYHVAVNCLRPGGTCGTWAYPGVFGEPIEHPGGFAFMNTRQMGILEGDSNPKVFIPQLAKMQISGQLPYDELITTFKFDDINDAIEACETQSVVKPVLVFE